MNILNKQMFCDGNITRSRMVNGKAENSIIDFILVCNLVFPFTKYMYIDEKREYAMANFCQKKKGKIAKLSDHNLIYADFDLKFQKQIPERRKIFKFNDPVAMQKFRNLTTKTNEFTMCFANSKPFNVQLKSWEKVLQKFLHICFKRVRINKNGPSKKSNQTILFNKRVGAIKNKDTKKQEIIESKI